MNTQNLRFVPCSSCGVLNRIPLALQPDQKPSCGKCKTNLPHEKAVFEITGSHLGAAIRNSPVPVILDCWAPWCGPCRAFAPTFENFARNFPQASLCLKLNTEDHQTAAAELGIRSIPTLIIFSNGTEKSRQSGALSLPQLKAWLAENGVSGL